jgi:hypothetical protein
MEVSNMSEKANKIYRNWYNNHKEEYRPKKAALMKKYRSEDPEKYAAQSRKAKEKERETLFEMYGHVCAACGFADKRALTLDHKLNNGNKERKALGMRGPYRRAKKEYRPDEYQTLCMNCQFIKRVEAKRQNQHG